MIQDEDIVMPFRFSITPYNLIDVVSPLSHQNDTKQVELLQSLVTYNQRTLRLSSLCLVVVYL